MPGVTLNFEAVVCGGILIIHSLRTDYLGDSISRVMGIMNGTTNFMLSKMEDEGADLGASSLRGCGARPQYFRYAEANPEADVEGLDVHVGGILIKLLSNHPHQSIPTSPWGTPLCPQRS